MGAGVGVVVGDAEGGGAGVAGVNGVPGEGRGVTGGLVAGGAGGLTCARGAATDASTHPATIAAPKREARRVTR